MFTLQKIEFEKLIVLMGQHVDCIDQAMFNFIRFCFLPCLQIYNLSSPEYVMVSELILLPVRERSVFKLPL